MGENQRQVPLDQRLALLIRRARLAIQPLVEIYFGIKTRILPLDKCAAAGAFCALFVVTGLDYYIFKLTRTTVLYFFIYCFDFIYFLYAITLSLSGFLGWGMIQTVRLRILTKNLTETFINAGLKTPMNRLPAFISDKPIDQQTRNLRLRMNGIPYADFDKAKDRIGASLRVYVDDLREIRTLGVLDIKYATAPMPTSSRFENLGEYKEYCFVVGDSRSGRITINLKEVPHMLVGGVTNFGKSTFLRQAITTLYLNNPGTELTLIDLKRGLEFQIFEKLPRVNVVSNLHGAVSALRILEQTIEHRASLLKLNECKNIEVFLSKKTEDRKYPDDWRAGSIVGRHVVVIDEAAELFLAGGSQLDSKQTQEARRLASTLAAQGRAVGIHLIVATQRPDRNAVDPLTKTNLQGRLCFPMADNASSMTILDSVRAADLPSIKGRAIWRNGLDLIEVQVPELSEDEVKQLLLSHWEESTQTTQEIVEAQTTSQNLPVIKTTGNETIGISASALQAGKKRKSK